MCIKIQNKYKMLTKISKIILLSISVCSAMNIEEKMYLNEDDVKTSYDRFTSIWEITSGLKQMHFIEMARVYSHFKQV